MIDKIATKFGRKLHEVPIGFKYICELMLEQNILIGGEESGGFGTSLYLPERDATVSALFLAELMAWHGKSLGELLAALHAEFGEYHYGRVDLDVKAGQKQKAIAHFSDGKLKSLSIGRSPAAKTWTASKFISVKSAGSWCALRAPKICCACIRKRASRKPRGVFWTR